MKQLLLSLFILYGIFLSAQGFKNSEIDRLTSFGISVEKYDVDNFKHQNDITQILKFDKKHKRRKIGGIILGSFGLLSASAGTYGLIQSKDEPIGGVISGFILATGILEMGGSIPIFVSSKRKKRQRDEIIRKYNEAYGFSNKE